MKRDNIIEVNGLSASFKGKSVLDDVSFSIEKGKITIIIGRSGSGKTTILKHMLGLYPSQEESVKVLGRNPYLLSETEAAFFFRKIGVFYQNGALLNSLTIEENIALPLEQHTQIRSSLIDNIVKLKLQLVGLEGSGNKFPSELSGGMLKRAALARAITLDPPLLFCDEPGAGLDPVSLASLDELILKLKRLLGITVVLVTHEISTILRIADHVIFVDEGKIVFQGSVEKATSSQINTVREFFSRGKGEKTSV